MGPGRRGDDMRPPLIVRRGTVPERPGPVGPWSRLAIVGSVDTIIQVDERSFEEQVLRASREVPVVVDFWAAWCRPCLVLGPVLEGLAQEYGGRFVLAKLDVDANPMSAGRYGVRAIPTMVLFKEGKETERFVGYQPKERLLQQLAPHLEGVRS